MEIRPFAWQLRGPFCAAVRVRLSPNRPTSGLPPHSLCRHRGAYSSSSTSFLFDWFDYKWLPVIVKGAVRIGRCCQGECVKHTRPGNNVQSKRFVTQLSFYFNMQFMCLPIDKAVKFVRWSFLGEKKEIDCLSSGNLVTKVPKQKHRQFVIYVADLLLVGSFTGHACQIKES